METFEGKWEFSISIPLAAPFVADLDMKNMATHTKRHSHEREEVFDWGGGATSTAILCRTMSTHTESTVLSKTTLSALAVSCRQKCPGEIRVKTSTNGFEGSNNPQALKSNFGQFP
jgi:hypothetical protein